MADTDYASMDGRKPSFNARGNLRGFRSKPGAPMADPTQNIGALGTNQSSLTPANIWDQMFRNRITGETPSSLAAARNAPTQQVVPSFEDDTQKALDEIYGSNQPADLTQMAAGGTNHAQRWSGQTAQQPSMTSPWSQTVGQFGAQRSIKSPYGWGSAFIPYG